jgi:DNA-binding transcriptional regulator YiaG
MRSPSKQSDSMPNIASIFKSEVSRISRKEVRVETDTLRKATTQCRSDIAALKRRLSDMEKHVKKALRQRKGTSAETLENHDSAEPRAFRFSASGLAKHRQRLGLSAREVGALLGVSALSVYKWESGQTRPRAKQLERIAAFRSLGKKQAAAALAQVLG